MFGRGSPRLSFTISTPFERCYYEKPTKSEYLGKGIVFAMQAKAFLVVWIVGISLSLDFLEKFAFRFTLLCEYLSPYL